MRLVHQVRSGATIQTESTRSGVGLAKSISRPADSKQTLSFSRRPYSSSKRSGRNFFEIARGSYSFERETNVDEPRLSAWDKRKLYEPPLKGHEIPSNNPFYNKSFAATHKARTLNNWTAHSNTKRIQSKIKNRIAYLKFLSENKNHFLGEVAHLKQDPHMPLEDEVVFQE